MEPLVAFLHREATASVLLLVAAVTAFVWANSPWADRYLPLWHSSVVVAAGELSLLLSLAGIGFTVALS